MEIDWFTVGAQLVNFAILFALLSKFLYRPIIDAVDRREAKIAGRIEEAERREEEAEKSRRYYEDQLAELEKQREERLEETRREVTERRREMLEEVRREVQEAREQWFGRLRAEQKHFLADISERLEREVFAIAGDVLADLADVSGASRIVEHFVQRVESGEDPALEEIAAQLGGEDGRARVRTSFALEEDQRRRIEEALAGLFDGRPQVEFEHDERLVAGIEVRAGGSRFGWNVRSYLESLRNEIDSLLEVERVRHQEFDENRESA